MKIEYTEGSVTVNNKDISDISNTELCSIIKKVLSRVEDDAILQDILAILVESIGDSTDLDKYTLEV